jgi:hypothetical protein
MPFPNKFSVGFSYKHPDGNLTRIVQQLSVPAPFENLASRKAWRISRTNLLDYGA